MKNKTKAKSTLRSKFARHAKPRVLRMTRRKGHEDDILQLILEDHKPLKKLIKTLKSSTADFDDKKEAFEEFAPLILTHAKSEEETLYIFMKDGQDMREEGFEGDVEHDLATQMVEDARSTTDEDLFCARVKVLAELVEHHIEEEEGETLPAFARFSRPEEREDLGRKYRDKKEHVESRDDTTPPSEITVESRFGT